ncbi:hypothetical protein FOZ63_030126 [Perkinsus olseni]|uniref:Uncharacterized protein n=1 Tax=Perkinsus olseni TaxID=32597 RepID=A0A7J6TY38_PEROL|nr:hypothetical protein FOZ63_030126 [Perkinsus olseni]
MVSFIVSALGFLLASSHGTMAMQTTFEPAPEMNEPSRLSRLEGQVSVLSGVATTLHREIDTIIDEISKLKRKPSESLGPFVVATDCVSSRTAGAEAAQQWNIASNVEEFDHCAAVA